MSSQLPSKLMTCYYYQCAEQVCRDFGQQTLLVSSTRSNNPSVIVQYPIDINSKNENKKPPFLRSIRQDLFTIGLHIEPPTELNVRQVPIFSLNEIIVCIIARFIIPNRFLLYRKNGREQGKSHKKTFFLIFRLQRSTPFPQPSQRHF